MNKMFKSFLSLFKDKQKINPEDISSMNDVVDYINQELMDSSVKIFSKKYPITISFYGTDDELHTLKTWIDPVIKSSEVNSEEVMLILKKGALPKLRILMKNIHNDKN